MTDESDGLSCPRCGERIERVTAPDGEDEQVRVKTECPQCNTDLEIIRNLAGSSENTEMWVEDRRDDEN